MNANARKRNVLTVVAIVVYMSIAAV
jgi:hypothetical protein